MKKNLFLQHLAIFIILIWALPSLTQEITPDIYKSLQYRYIGPMGNRIIAVVGEPENANVYYCGAAANYPNLLWEKSASPSPPVTRTGCTP